MKVLLMSVELHPHRDITLAAGHIIGRLVEEYVSNSHVVSLVPLFWRAEWW
jgi:hypothetical protein